MIVSMWMTRDVVTVGPGTSITDAAALMAARHIRRLPVIKRNPDGPLVGIVSATDIFHAFPPHVNPFGIMAPDTHQSRVTVADIMRRDPPITTPDAPIEEAARVMRDQKIGALPVVHKGALVGLITDSDIFRAFVGLFEAPGGGVRITFDVSRDEDTLGRLIQVAGRRGVRVVSLIPSQQGDRPVCVVRVTGGAIDDFLDDLRKSGHHVLNVLRMQ